MPASARPPQYKYDTHFQRVLCHIYRMDWKRAVIVDWVSQGAAYKDIADWLDIEYTHIIHYHLSMAYRKFGISGTRARLLLVGIRLHAETLTVPERPADDGRHRKGKS